MQFAYPCYLYRKVVMYGNEINRRCYSGTPKWSHPIISYSIHDPIAQDSSALTDTGPLLA